MAAAFRRRQLSLVSEDDEEAASQTPSADEVEPPSDDEANGAAAPAASRAQGRLVGEGNAAALVDGASEPSVYVSGNGPYRGTLGRLASESGAMARVQFADGRAVDVPRVDVEPLTTAVSSVPLNRCVAIVKHGPDRAKRGTVVGYESGWVRVLVDGEDAARPFRLGWLGVLGDYVGSSDPHVKRRAARPALALEGCVTERPPSFQRIRRTIGSGVLDTFDDGGAELDTFQCSCISRAKWDELCAVATPKERIGVECNEVSAQPKSNRRNQL